MSRTKEHWLREFENFRDEQESSLVQVMVAPGRGVWVYESLEGLDFWQSPSLGNTLLMVSLGYRLPERHVDGECRFAIINFQAIGARAFAKHAYKQSSSNDIVIIPNDSITTRRYLGEGIWVTENVNRDPKRLAEIINKRR